MENKVVLSVLLPDSMKHDLYKWAADENVSLSDKVRELLEAALKERQDDKPAR